MEYYVFALDTVEGLITAAMSCPDEQAAQQAYLTAKRKFEFEYGKMDSIHFGFTGVDSQVAISGKNYTRTTAERFGVSDMAFQSTEG